MEPSSKTMDALKLIGLNKYERNLWVALLAKGKATVGTLAEISGVTRSRCYDVLESLASKGFVVVQSGKPIKYVAVKPSEAFERIKKKIQKDAESMIEKISRAQSSDTVKELDRIYKSTFSALKPEDITGTFTGKDAVLRHLESMLKGAKKSIKIIATEKLFQGFTRSHYNLLEGAAKKGVEIRIAIPYKKETEELVKRLSKIAKLKDISDVEHVEKITGQMLAVDGKEIMVGLSDDEKVHPSEHISFWTGSSHATSKMFDPLFELVWEHAKPLK